MIEAILFDLDGVLVDACDWHYEALNYALKEIVNLEISLEDHQKIYNGLPTRVKLDKLGLKEQDRHRIIALKQRYTKDLIKMNLKESADKVSLMSWLKANDYKIGCVTNSIKETAHLMLELSGVKGFLDIIITNEDVINNKPFPECYNKAVKDLGILPDNILCVEDSSTGIMAVRSSNITNLMVVKNAIDVNLKNIRKALNEDFNTYGRLGQ